MKKTYLIIASIIGLSFVLNIYAFFGNDTMLNKRLVSKYKEIIWHESHIEHVSSKNDSYLGGGMMYYGIVQTNRSQVCVVIGSGGGFVPKLVAQAQRDSKIKGYTYYIDADIF